MDPPERNQQRTRGLRSIMHADCIVILLGGILSIQVEQHLYKSTRTRDQRTKYVFTPALHSLSTRSHQAWPSLIKTLAGCRLGEKEWLWLLLIKKKKKRNQAEPSWGTKVKNKQTKKQNNLGRASHLQQEVLCGQRASGRRRHVKCLRGEHVIAGGWNRKEQDLSKLQNHKECWIVWD